MTPEQACDRGISAVQACAWCGLDDITEVACEGISKATEKEAEAYEACLALWEQSTSGKCSIPGAGHNDELPEGCRCAIGPLDVEKVLSKLVSVCRDCKCKPQGAFGFESNVACISRTAVI